MIIVLDLEFRATIIKQIAEREFSDRSGVHSTDLIYCLNKQALRKLKPVPDTDEDTLRFSLGWSTQRWLTGNLKDADPVEVDGIIVTPDVMLDEPWELKATYQSSGKPIDENLSWIRQIMAQCYVTGSLTAKLTRLEIMGNWSWVYRPKNPEKIKALVEQYGEKWDAHPTLSAYHFEFTQEELDRHWAWMQERRDLYIKILETGKLAPRCEALAKGNEFECEYCPYNCEP